MKKPFEWPAPKEGSVQLLPFGPDWIGSHLLQTIQTVLEGVFIVDTVFRQEFKPNRKPYIQATSFSAF